MEKKMETTIALVLWRIYMGIIGVMEKKMETLGPLKGVYRDYWVILGLCWGNGKENGNYYSIIGYICSKLWYPLGYILGLYWGHIGRMEKKMETTGIIGTV